MAIFSVLSVVLLLRTQQEHLSAEVYEGFLYEMTIHFLYMNLLLSNQTTLGVQSFWEINERFPK